jgi:hypothetical protein
MLFFISGIIVILHGLVHLLYFGQSRRFFELQPGMTWPDGSWALSKLLGNEATRTLASALCILTAIVFFAGGIGMFAKSGFWRPLVISGVVLSTFAYLLLWDGKLKGLDHQGGIGILINLAILASLVIFQWPKLET